MDSIFEPDAQHSNLKFKIVAGLDRISQALRAQMWEYGKNYGLTPIQLQCLIFLKYHDASRRKPGHLAREFDVTPATISQAVRTLTQKGFIEKKKLESDARVQILELTSAGRDICEKVDTWANSLLPHLENLPAEHQPVILEFLLNLIASLQKAGVLSEARQCPTCRFFKENAEGNGFYCKLLEQNMQTADLRIDCPEHERG